MKLVADLSELCSQMVVIEERRSFLEKNIRDAPLPRLSGRNRPARSSAALYGKSFPHGLAGIPEARGLNPSVLAQVLIPLIKATEQIPAEKRNGRLTAELDLLRKASKPKLQVISDKIIPRTATFCPGCPHRDSSATLLELRQNFADPKYMREHHGSGPVDLVAHGDTGCYTMLMFAPTEQLMHNYSGMGLGGGTGSGIDPFITNKQIVFMGDGTFFHSGQIAISNSIKLNQNITYIILENKTTAMTGHQEHAGTELDVVGNRSYIQDIETIVPRDGRDQPADRREPFSRRSLAISPGARTHDPARRRESHHRRQGMRDHPSPSGPARRTQDHQKAWLSPEEDAHECHDGGLRELPGMHEADRVSRT